ncbi:hypothetical protein M0412_15360 [Agrobacterium sp. O3.4]|uniref:Uncharacterized protein n=1 Tax=Agrobacterium cucumeris TaxID=2862866 RepID=A0ABY8RRL7_9HYPH|nr:MULTISPECIES: hypothetical protein [Rhizobium/Agrobacterium group]MCZ7469063.1 hypothetical protein [Rhizobium rhizogenes]WHO10240.1 hypothetical protein KZ699_17145 [Agrobacterium cucumeris]
MSLTTPTRDNRYQLPSWPPTEFTADLWNAIFGDLADRIAAREQLEATFETLKAQGIQASLDYIQINVAPQIVNLQQSITLAQNQIDQIIVGGKAPDALKFGGQLPAHYATASALSDGLAGKVPNTRKVNGKELSGDIAIEKGDVGLGNANNTADKDKPVSDAQQQAIDAVVLAAANSTSTKASKRNRHLNPAFQVCQDRTSGTIDVGSAQYVMDGVHVNSTGGGVLRAGQLASDTPGGSPYRFRATVLTSDAAFGTGDYYGVVFPIEGIEVADLKFGTADAMPFVWRGVVKLPQGSYGLSFTNTSLTRSYVKMFTVTAAEANKDKLITAVVPGCKTGTWVKDSSASGLSVRITLSSGSSFLTAQENEWVNGNFVATASLTPFMATVGNIVEVADIGLYAGGQLPEWELPNIGDVWRACMRYYFRSTIPKVALPDSITGNGADVRTKSCYMDIGTRMRATPSVTVSAGFTGFGGVETLTASINGRQDTFQANSVWIADARI